MLAIAGSINIGVIVNINDIHIVHCWVRDEN